MTKNANSMTAGAIFKAKRRTPERVDLPIGGHVFMQTMNGGRRSEFEARLIADDIDPKTDPGRFRAELVAHTAVDDDGGLIFSTNQLEQILSLDADVLELMVDVACRLNAFSEKDREGLEKN